MDNNKYNTWKTKSYILFKILDKWMLIFHEDKSNSIFQDVLFLIIINGGGVLICWEIKNDYIYPGLTLWYYINLISLLIVTLFNSLYLGICKEK